MARIRTIKPEFFYSEQIAAVSMAARMFFIGLWTLSDRDGRLKWTPRKIKAQIFPYDDEVDVAGLAEELAGAGLLHVYEAQDATFIWIPGFSKHQRPHPREPASSIPECPENHDSKDVPWQRNVLKSPNPVTKPCPAVIRHSSIPPSTVGREGKGMDKGKGRSTGTGTILSSSMPLVMSPTRFARLQETHVFIGSRFRVPNGLHDDLRSQLGGEHADARLTAWYEQLNADAEVSGEAIPEMCAWVREKFKTWVAEQSFDAEMEKFRRMGQ